MPALSLELIPAEFADTGFWAAARANAPIKQFQVLGERSSGTNFIKRLLGQNSNLQPSEMLGWKHGFCQTDAIPADLAVILVVRRADDWARSMHAKPWHCSAAMQALEFDDFIRAPWDTVIDRPRYFKDARPRGIVGQALQHDRHPLTGAQFENLFALRRAKLDGLLSYLHRGCTVLVLRMETAQAAPEATLDAMLKSFDQPIGNADFKPVFKRLGSKFKPAIAPRPSTPASLTSQQSEFLHRQLDLKLEAALGYYYD